MTDLEEPVERGDLRPGLVLPVRVSPDGPTRKQARGPFWRRTSHGFYVPADVDVGSVEQRIVEASVVVPEGRGVITGWAALRWQGATWFTGETSRREPRPVTVAVSTFDIRPQAGIAVSGESVAPALRRWVDGVPVADPRAALSFEMRYAGHEAAAAVALDLACFDDLVSVQEMEEFLSTQNGWTGVPRARAALALADENSWSPTESRARMLWSLSGLGTPLANRPVFDGQSSHIATPDLLDPRTGVLVEYDGAAHLTEAGRHRDVGREATYRRHGLEPVTMTSSDLRDPSGFLRRLRDAYQRAALSAAHCDWTTSLPAGWTPTHTVALRRALDLDQRQRLLRYRRPA